MKTKIIILLTLLLLVTSVFCGCNGAEEIKPQPAETQSVSAAESTEEIFETVTEVISVQSSDTVEATGQGTTSSNTFTEAETELSQPETETEAKAETLASEIIETTVAKTFGEPVINFSDLE